MVGPYLIEVTEVGIPSIEIEKELENLEVFESRERDKELTSSIKL